MSTTTQLVDYNQTDVQRLYNSGSIIPSIDAYGNLTIQNTTGQLYSSSVTIPLVNVVYNDIKVETKNDPVFYEL